jgi:hypothetical protein
MSILLDHFVHQVETDKTLNDGIVLEFGTGSGRSTAFLATYIKGPIITFDGFAGLPKTEKGVPIGTGWEEGALFFEEQETRKLLEPFPHVTVHKCMTFDLKDPIEYGIQKIRGVNLDLDLYEGTLDALRFISKCEWDSLILRFDDWGYYEGIQIKEQVEAHEQAAFRDFLEETGYQAFTNPDINQLSGNRQSIYKITRSVR